MAPMTMKGFIDKQFNILRAELYGRSEEILDEDSTKLARMKEAIKTATKHVWNSFTREFIDTPHE